MGLVTDKETEDAYWLILCPWVSVALISFTHNYKRLLYFTLVLKWPTLSIIYSL